MVEIYINSNQGITSAIKAKLNEQGYDTSEMTGSIWTQVMQEVAKENAKNLKEGKEAIYRGGSDLFGSGHENFVVDKGPKQIAQNLWNKIVSIVCGKSTVKAESPITTENVSSTADVNKVNSVPETRTTSAVEPPAELKQNVEKAQTYLTNQLTNLSKEDLGTMGISEAKRDRILEYLKNITYDTDHDSAQAKGAGIVFSTQCKDTDNLANMVTLLMHEANHCDENYLDMYPEDSESGDLRHRNSNGNPVARKRLNTKEEERACETLGLMTTAVLIKKGVLKGYDDYGRYGGDNNGKPNNPVTSYLDNPDLLKNDIDNWVSGYTNYPEGLNNAGLTVEHLKHIGLPENIQSQSIQLKAGDIIKVGDKEYTLGGDNGLVLAPMDSIPVFQMIPNGDVNNGNIGNIVFDEVKPDKQELEFFNGQNNNDNYIYDVLNRDNPETVVVIRDGKLLYTGKKY